MQLYLKLALGNVRRGARDYSVYFATPDSAAWTAGCFAVVFAVNAVDGAARYRAAPADRAHDRPRRRAGGAAEGMIVGLCHSA